MTERGLPTVDGAPACPFVAFEDDRDERATSPDHRHRCYAEAQPAPRALAHQEAYCLSSAFPVCPTFQDWARREAARSRADAPRQVDSATAESDQPQRNPPRNWAAPPPWLSRAGRGGPEADGDWGDDDADESADDPDRPEVPRRGRGLSGSYADRVASDPAAAIPGGMDDDVEEDIGDAAAASAPPRRGSDEGYGPPDDPALRTRRRERVPGRLTGGADAAAVAAGRSEHRPERERLREGPAPEWERAKPLEAYPTLRSRRLAELSVPPILVAVVAIALSAAVLFALPGLLGFGDPRTGASTAPSTPIRTPLPSLAPTPVPQPTVQIYLVQAGDTMSRIAGRFDIPLADLIAANTETVPNPDSLQIGQEVIIPTALPTALPAASEIPAAS